MRITEGQLRRVIREELLREARITPELAASQGLRFVVRKTKRGKGGWNVMCLFDSPDVRDPVMGQIDISLPLGKGRCRDAYEVTKSEAGFDGLGPLLYDIAMELAGPAGLMSDRELVSPEARRVWRYYHNNRPDVDHEQLDSKPGTITPDIEEDDCAQDSSRTRLSPGETWQGSPLSKVYRKRGTPVLDELQAMGLITFI